MTTLQWSHNFFVMEMFVPFVLDVWQSGLQWSHNFFVMEICRLFLYRSEQNIDLQWSHNFFVMEMVRYC